MAESNLLKRIFWNNNNSQVNNSATRQKSLINTASSLGYSYLWWSCWDYIVSMYDYYNIQKKNPAAYSMVSKISQKVWKNGIYLQDSSTWEVVDDPKTMASIISFFYDSSFRSFKHKYYTQYFASGDIYLGVKQVNGVPKAMVIDSRTMSKLVNRDNSNEIVGFKQKVNSKTWVKEKKFTTDEIYNNIVRQDINNPLYGMSIYVPVVYDALAAWEISRRNFFFFRNDAKPWMVIAFDPNVEGVSQDEYEQLIKDFEHRHQWSKNYNKVMASNYIRDIKLIESNHKDLELIKLDVMTIKKIGMIFWIDPRLLWFSDDVGAYATMNKISEHSLESMQSYQNDLEQDMNVAYRMFIDEQMPYIIRLEGETFENKEVVSESHRKDVELWIMTIEEVRAERWLSIDKLPDRAKTPLIRTNIENNPQSTL